MISCSPRPNFSEKTTSSSLRNAFRPHCNSRAAAPTTSQIRSPPTRPRLQPLPIAHPSRLFIPAPFGPPVAPPVALPAADFDDGRTPAPSPPAQPVGNEHNQQGSAYRGVHEQGLRRLDRALRHRRPTASALARMSSGVTRPSGPLPIGLSALTGRPLSRSATRKSRPLAGRTARPPCTAPTTSPPRDGRRRRRANPRPRRVEVAALTTPVTVPDLR